MVNTGKNKYPPILDQKRGIGTCIIIAGSPYFTAVEGVMNMDLNHFCLGCMENRGTAQQCPFCGFVEGTEAESPHHIPPGTILLGKFLIGKVLGQGGFGITYLALDLNLDLKLAIKEFFPHGLVARIPGTSDVDTYIGKLKNQYAFGLDRFLNEAKTLARFSEHPNIVTVRDFFRLNKTAYMVMNYVEGVTLQTYLANQEGEAISFARALDIFLPVLDALKEVHALGVIHRDISPDNLLITTRGQAVLTDFGSARQALSEKDRSLSVILKAGYSPEEQYRSKGKQGPWTDVYAVAATFYHSITGQLPPESLDRLAEDSLLPPSQLGVEISEEQEKVLLQALAVLYEERYGSVEEFREALIKSLPDGEEMTSDPLLEEGPPAKEDDAALPVAEETALAEGKTEQPQPGEIAIVNGHKKSSQGVKLSIGVRKAGLIALLLMGFGLLLFGSISLFGANDIEEVESISWQGGTYSGDLRNGIPHGKGTWIHPDGDEYVGEWKDGEQDGAGTMIWLDGKKYVGDWKDGNRHGYGNMTWPDGYEYAGEWVADRKHGQGTMTYPDGRFVEEEWEDGEPVKW